MIMKQTVANSQIARTIIDGISFFQSRKNSLLTQVITMSTITKDIVVRSIQDGLLQMMQQINAYKLNPIRIAAIIRIGQIMVQLPIFQFVYMNFNTQLLISVEIALQTQYYNIYKSIFMIQTKATILCALCGIKFTPQSGTICPTCTIKSIQQEKLLEGDIVNYCRYCMRWERPPWINCQRQSQQMMGILLKKIKGLNKVQVQSASFVWTEPHSKRFKLKVVFNRDVGQNMKIQVTEVVQFVEKYVQCNDCRKKFTPHDWMANVQIRQQTSHKKTIFNLQQILLKQKLSEKIIKSEQVQGGMDVFFSSESDAIRLVDFLKSKFPTLNKTSSKLISYNERDNITNLKITHSCTIPKICRDDLVRIPRKLSKQLGSCSQVLLCTKVSSNLHFLDLATFRKIQINATQYFLYEVDIEIFPIKVYGKKFQVLDCQVKDPQTHNKYPSFGFTVLKQQQGLPLYTKCHFEDEPGNQLIGFDLTQIQNIEGVKNLPDYLMVLKIKDKQQKRKNKSKRRKRQAQQRKKQSEAASKLAANEQRDQDLDDESQEDQWEQVDQEEQEEQHKQTKQQQNQVKTQEKQPQTTQQNKQ